MSSPENPAAGIDDQDTGRVGFLDAVRALAAHRAESWSLTIQQRRETIVELSSGAVDTVQTAHARTVYLRLVADGRVGAATVCRLTDPERLVRDAIDCARCGPAAPEETAPSPTALTAQCSETPIETAKPLNHDRVVEGARALAGQVEALQKSSGLLLHATIRRVEESVHLASPDSKGEDRQAYWSIGGVAEASRTQDLQLGWSAWMRAAALPSSLCVWLEAAGPWQELPVRLRPSGAAQLLLGPDALHTLLSPLIASLSGASRAMGRSFIDAFGRPLLDRRVSLDDGASGGPDAEESGSDGLPLVRVDDEGSPCSPLTLIADGVPVHAYHTRHSAALDGVRPTGHGFRGNTLRRRLAQPVSAVLNNAELRVAPELGAGPQELVAAVERGILVDSFLGGLQKGRLSPIVQARIRVGLLIERGRVTARLDGEPLSLDLRRVLGPDLAGASTQRWPVSRMWTGRLPFVLIRTGGREAA